MGCADYKFPVKKDMDAKGVAVSNSKFRSIKSFEQGIGDFTKTK